MTRRSTPAGVVLWVVLAAGCGQASPPTTSPPATTPATTPAPTTTPTTVPPANPWTTLLGEVSAPAGWTVAACEGDQPLLCVEHDGLTSRVAMERTPLEGSEMVGFLTDAGAPPADTDLGAAAAYPSILRALRARAEQGFADYTAAMEPEFPEGHTVFEEPVIAPMGELNGLRYAYRIDDVDGLPVAWSIDYVAFDGETLWQAVAEFDPATPGDGFSDLDTLAEVDPHLSIMMRSLHLDAAVPGTVTDTIVFPATGELPATWTERFVIPYGTEDSQLGTAPGGDSGSLMLGPEFGAQGADGTWRILDAAKRRIAHFDGDGGYLDQLVLGPDLLVDGVYFQWQLPHLLDDGTTVATRLATDDTTLLVVRDGSASTTRLGVAVNPKTDDGKTVFGLGRGGSAWAIDPGAGTADATDWFRTRAGTRFQLWVSAGAVTVWLPDAPTPNIHRLELTYGPDPADGVWTGVEAATGIDGSLYLLLLGGTDSGTTGQLGGFVAIDPDGVVAPIETVRPPQDRSEPGSPAHLGSSPVTGRPWLMYVDPDGVRVFERG